MEVTSSEARSGVRPVGFLVWGAAGFYSPHWDWVAAPGGSMRDRWNPCACVHSELGLVALELQLRSRVKRKGNKT